MSLTLTVLGCDGSYPGPGGAGSGYLLRSGGTAVWLDAGPGTLAALQSHIDIEEIGAVVITHEHIDHWSDLEHLAVAVKWVVPRPPVPLYSEAELGSTGSAGTFAHRAIAPGESVDMGPMRLSFFRTDHTVATLAVRVDAGGRSLGYSADTGPGWDMAEMGPVDLLLSEACYTSDLEGRRLPHLSGRQAGAAAKAAGAKRLVVTHIWPRVDHEAVRAEAEAAFGAPVALARAGEGYQI